MKMGGSVHWGKWEGFGHDHHIAFLTGLGFFRGRGSGKKKMFCQEQTDQGTLIAHDCTN
jgi:hypothetical protein